MTTQINEGDKFTITGKLNGQAGRVFITGKSGYISSIKTKREGTPREYRVIEFTIDDTSGLRISHAGFALESIFVINTES